MPISARFGCASWATLKSELQIIIDARLRFFRTVATRAAHKWHLADISPVMLDEGKRGLVRPPTDVRLWHIADLAFQPADVRYWG